MKTIGLRAIRDDIVLGNGVIGKWENVYKNVRESV